MNSYSFLFAPQRSSMSMVAPPEDFTGQVVQVVSTEGVPVGSAVLVEQVASSCFSQIYKGIFEGSGPLHGKLLVAKVLTTSNPQTAQKADGILKRLYDREVTALMTVRHKNVIPLIGVGEIRTQPQEAPVDSPRASLLTSLRTGHNQSYLDSQHAPGSIHANSPSHYASFAQQPSCSSFQQSLGLGDASRTADIISQTPDSPSSIETADKQRAFNTLNQPSYSSSPRFRANSTDGSSVGGGTGRIPTIPQASVLDASSLETPTNAFTPANIQEPQGGPQRVPGSLLQQSSLRQAGSFLGGRMLNRTASAVTGRGRSNLSSSGPTLGRRVIFLPWICGGDARGMLERNQGGMPEHVAGVVIYTVAEALAAAHALGIVHRDVKASNVFLDDGIGNVRLGDWGIAVSEMESLSRMSNNGSTVRAAAAVGTEFWCAPEIEMGWAHDHKADVFSLAITFIELVTGCDPRYDNTPEGFSKIAQHETGLVPYEDLSQDALSWLLPCLAADPKQRPSIPQLLAHPWFADALANMQSMQAMAEQAANQAAEAGDLAMQRSQSGEEIAAIGTMRPQLTAALTTDDRNSGNKSSVQALNKLGTGVVDWSGRPSQDIQQARNAVQVWQSSRSQILHPQEVAEPADKDEFDDKPAPRCGCAIC